MGHHRQSRRRRGLHPPRVEDPDRSGAGHPSLHRARRPELDRLGRPGDAGRGRHADAAPHGRQLLCEGHALRDALDGGESGAHLFGLRVEGLPHDGRRLRLRRSPRRPQPDGQCQAPHEGGRARLVPRVHAHDRQAHERRQELDAARPLHDRHGRHGEHLDDEHDLGRLGRSRGPREHAVRHQREDEDGLRARHGRQRQPSVQRGRGPLLDARRGAAATTTAGASRSP